MRMRRLALVLVWAVLIVGSLDGCTTTAPTVREQGSHAAPNFSYAVGRGSQDFPALPGSVDNAVLEAMDDLRMTVVKRTRDGSVVQVDGRTPDQRTVTVTLRPQQSLIRVSCRIGWFGDEPLSRTLLERVGVRLGLRPPEAIPDRPPSAPASNPLFSRQAVPDAEILRDFAEAPYRDRVDP